MVFKPRPFNKSLKRRVQDFEGQTEGHTEIELRSNCDDIIINLIFFKR